MPIAVKNEILYSQSAATDEDAYFLDGQHFLNGSAEQGILDYFASSGNKIKAQRVYAFTHCFRRERNLEDLYKLKEFKKIEQFSFVKPRDWESEFEFLLSNATSFLENHGIKYRTLDVTKRDPGYHLRKVDIEIYTARFGWMESHSCTYFGDQQVNRVDIETNCHTISNTGIASPRILIPFIERNNALRYHV